MFLSKVELTRELLGKGDHYQIHKALWTLFETEQERCFLYRLEHSEVLMQSNTEPAMYGERANIKAIREYDPAIVDNRRFRFRVRVNPVKRLATPKGEKGGPRVPLIREDEIRVWLDRQVAGAAVRDSTINVQPVQVSRKGKRLMHHQAAQCDGILDVLDSNAFRHKVEAGLGPAKAFGFGLISLVPI